MITEISSLDHGATGRRRRRTAIAAALPLAVGGALAAEAVTAAAGHDHVQVTRAASPAIAPAATPCPTPRTFATSSTPQRVAPSAMLANHQPCNHHEGMVTAFRWL